MFCISHCMFVLILCLFFFHLMYIINHINEGESNERGSNECESNEGGSNKGGLNEGE